MSRYFECRFAFIPASQKGRVQCRGEQLNVHLLKLNSSAVAGLDDKFVSGNMLSMDSFLKQNLSCLPAGVGVSNALAPRCLWLPSATIPVPGCLI